MDPDPAIFVTDLQVANRKLIEKKKFFCLLLFVGTFTSFFEDKLKESKRSHKAVGIKVFVTIFASVADPGFLSRIPDPDFYPSRIPDLGSKNSNKRQG